MLQGSNIAYGTTRVILFWDPSEVMGRQALFSATLPLKYPVIPCHQFRLSQHSVWPLFLCKPEHMVGLSSPATRPTNLTAPLNVNDILRILQLDLRSPQGRWQRSLHVHGYSVRRGTPKCDRDRIRYILARRFPFLPLGC